MKTVTEIRRSSARDTVIAERVYLVLNSLLDWKPVEILKQRCDMGSFTCTCVSFFLSFFVFFFFLFFFFLSFFSMKRAEQFCMRRWLWTEEAGGPEKTMAVVKA